MAADLRPIRSESNYRDALSDVERLWGSRTGTPEGDRPRALRPDPRLRPVITRDSETAPCSRSAEQANL
jgi:hypothetical protein